MDMQELRRDQNLIGSDPSCRSITGSQPRGRTLCWRPGSAALISRAVDGGKAASRAREEEVQDGDRGWE